MPWKNRYIGNPILTGILNILFRAGISDAHCGIRALTRSTFDRLQLSGDGMEFASEMVIKAALLGCAIAEVPATLSRDLRDRPPHLRPWRDGWRHLRYLLMLSPTWLFAAPAALFAGLALGILALAGIDALQGSFSYVGNYWIILAGGLLTVAHSAVLLAAAGNLYGVREGYRRRSDRSKVFARWVSLEMMLIVGAICLLAGGSILAGVRRLLVGATLRAAVECPARRARHLVAGHRRAEHPRRLPDCDRQRQRRGLRAARAHPCVGRCGAGKGCSEPGSQ